eukprot:m.39079 g.39079  ORF g.39079 m.39079 type:complete len:479 (+) comp5925_c0_seq1:202-1638(+)
MRFMLHIASVAISSIMQPCCIAGGAACAAGSLEHRSSADTWSTGSVLIAILAFASFVTVSFMVEAMAAANAYTKETKEPSTSIAINSEKAQLLSQSKEEERVDKFEITRQIEMGGLAEMFFPRIGVQLFYACVIIYLYGDLCIYAVAVPKSLQRVICTKAQSSDPRVLGEFDEDADCLGSLSARESYYVFLALFSALLGPFCFTDVQKTKWLQMTTTLLRWTTFLMMIIIALVGIISHEGFKKSDPKPPKASDIRWFGVSGLPVLFGAAIYSFMCHHSLPSLVTPIDKKNRLSLMFVIDFVLVALFYLLLCFTAVFRFPGANIEDLYTLNFKDFSNKFCSYFLGLFPVFTLSANFPIIAITLRNNLRTLISPFARNSQINHKHLYAVLAIVPPIFVAFFTENVGFLVSFTGSYAGVGIQYVTPAFLCLYARKHIRRAEIAGHNIHSSWFSHVYWIYGVLAWSALCIILVTVNHIREHK